MNYQAFTKDFSQAFKPFVQDQPTIFRKAFVCVGLAVGWVCISGLYAVICLEEKLFGDVNETNR